MTSLLTPLSRCNATSLGSSGVFFSSITVTSFSVLSTETNSIVDTLTVTAEPSCVAVSPDDSRLYIADHEGTVTVMSASLDDAATEMIAIDVDTVPELRELAHAGV